MLTLLLYLLLTDELTLEICESFYYSGDDYYSYDLLSIFVNRLIYFYLVAYLDLCSTPSTCLFYTFFSLFLLLLCV